MKLKKFREHLISNLIFIIYFSIVVFTAVSAPILYSNWGELPFLGGFLDPTLHFKQFSKLLPQESWPNENLDWGLETRLMVLDVTEIDTNQDVLDFLAKKHPDQSILVTVRSNDAVECVPIVLTRFNNLDRLLYFFLPYLAGLICLISSVWILSDQRKQPISTAYAFLSASIALVFFTQFDFYTTHKFAPLLFLGVAMSAGTFFQIAVLLPRGKRLIKNSVWASLIAYPLNLLLVGLGVFQLQNATPDTQVYTTLSLLIVSLGLSIIMMIVMVVLLRTETLSPLVERQSKTILYATILSALPFTISTIVCLLNHTEPFTNPLLLVSFCLLPGTFALLRRPYSLPQTRLNVYQILIHALLTVFFGLVYSLIVFIINGLLVTPIAPDNPMLIGGLIFLTVLVLNPLRTRIYRILNLDTSSSLSTNVDLTLGYTEKLSAAGDMDSAIQILYDAILEILQPKHIYIFLYNPELPGYRPYNPGLHHPDDLVLPSDSNLASTFKKLRQSIYFQDSRKIPKDFKEDNAVLEKLDARLHIPIPGSYGILGWVSLGDKLRNEQYETQDINLLESLTTQFALVYERSDTINAISHRLKEMEALNQIAVAINNITDVDQLLMAIFHNIQQIIQIDGLSLVMETDDNGHYQRQFLYENGATIISNTAPKALEEDFPEKQAIITRQSLLQQEESTTWLIVLLETEERTIGALSLRALNDLTTFDHMDLNLINSIANLVTGAIIKTRLLQSSQSQAQHLALLNKVSRQLNSTLVVERVLKTIVDNALEILNSTSGILMVLDETADQLVIEVSAGKISPTVLGKQVPKRGGIAGDTYFTHQPTVRNDISPEQLSPSLLEDEIGIKIENILAFPLVSQGEVMGILEIINKNNSLPFTEKDQEMLEGFASQAAVALHNAKLYTKTDQALEYRIEQLSTMQEIDRGLHSSQNLDVALQLTLQAAITHTQATYGTIAMVDTFYHQIENIWQISPGSDDPTSLKEISLKDFFWFSEESTEPYQIINSSVSELSEMLKLPKTHQLHFLIQAKLEDSKYCLLILHLDSPDKLNDQNIEFLIRLNDHATIALRNTVLYEDLQDAVQSKNEFISFISHELKNPLTAIKGHADILAKGMVGKVNEEQEDFLRTISHNVRRMNTFITDLSDQSQIESKSLRIIFDSANVEEMVNEVLQSYAQQMLEKSLTVNFHVKDTLPQIWCDRLRLIQILSNLVSNAIKYTPEGGKIEITAEYAINNWDQEGAAEVVHFAVKDNGYGISPEDQEHLFEKFYRGTDDTILKISGTGLGLRISKSLTEMMGGTLWFESTQGEGSTFHFTIPI